MFSRYSSKRTAWMTSSTRAKFTRSLCPSSYGARDQTSLRRIEHLAHFPGQALRREGLLDESGARVQHAVVNDGIVSVARHEDHLEPGPLGGEPVGELATAHSRHHHVSHEQVVDAVVALAEPDRLGRVARR